GPIEYHDTAFEGVWVLRIRQVALPELFRDHARFHDCRVEQVSRQHLEAGMLLERLAVRTDHVGIRNLGALDVFPEALATDRQRIAMNAARSDQFIEHRR